MQGLLDIDTTLKKPNLRLKAALLEAIFVKKLALKDGSGRKVVWKDAKILKYIFQN